MKANSRERALVESAERTFVLENSIGYLINRAARDMQNALDKKLAPFAVTAAQWSILIRCLSDGPQPPGALTRQLAVDASAVTRLLDRLSAKGLVVRKESLSDRRAIFVELTPKGREMVVRLPPLAMEVLEQFLDGFSKSDVDRFRDYLQRLVQNGEETSE